MTKKIFSSLIGALCCIFAFQANAQIPVLKPFTFDNPANIVSVSNNGLWAVAYGDNADNSTIYDYPYVIDLTTYKATYLLTDNEIANGTTAASFDISDDGSIVAGCYNEYPAYYKDNKWNILPVTGNVLQGAAYSISPDGRYMVGRSSALSINGNYYEYPFLWVDGVFTQCPGLPTKDIQGNDVLMNRFISISPDGNTILGCLNFSYLGSGLCAYVYDRATQTYEYIGKNEMSSEEFIDYQVMSANGEWIAGTMLSVTQIADESTSEYVPFTYNVKTKVFTKYDDDESFDVGVFAIGNDGTMIGCSPYVNPVRSLKYRVGNYWYNLDDMLQEKYGIDFTAATGFDYTGVSSSISSDCKTIAAMASPNTQNYILTLPETFAEAAKGVNLLASYTVSPAAGSTFNKASTFTITFEREAVVLDGARSKVQLYEGENLLATALSVRQSSQSTKTFQIGFAPKTLEEGKRYTLKIEEGCFGLENSDMVNNAISVTYIGRSNKPVTPLQYSMPDGTEQSELSYLQNLTISFDIPVSVVENKVAYLYQDNNSEPLCQLQLATSSNYLAAYPLTTQHLYLGSSYKVVIPAGVITDSQGDCGNEEIVLNYTGIYKKEAPSPGSSLFDVDFNDPSNSYNYFLMYDGDKLTPTEEMQGYGFDSLNTPWNFSIRESASSSDYCAAATSTYNPAGTSEDWLSTVQLEIPSTKYLLSWKSQSFKTDKNDVLRVYVWQCDDELNTLSADVVKRIEAEGELVYEATETPGASESNLSDDWKENKVELDKYAGKKIYIAFLNRNTDQSMIFIDDVKVDYNGKFSIGNTTPEIVKMQTEIPVSGFAEIISKEEGAEFTEVKATLKDANGAIVDTKVMSDLNLVKGDRCEFTFDKKLPVASGKITAYTISIEIDGDENSISSTVKNLSFAPVKRVVLEEGTGSWCANCPLGILAIEHLQQSYPDNFIPIAIHSNSGGNDAFDFSTYASTLGFTAFPTGRIDRISTIYSPVIQENSVYSFTSSTQDQTFTDIFLSRIEEGSEFDVKVNSAVYDTDINTVSIKATATPAVDITNGNYRVAFTFLENNLTGIQSNVFSSMEDPLFGEWGKGGRYGRSAVLYNYDHVARAVIGSSIDGVSGIIPTTMTASTEYPIEMNVNIPTTISNLDNAAIVCMLINANTGLVVNAAELNLANATGVNDNLADDSNITTAIIDNKVIATFADDANATISLYGVNGTLINQRAAKAGAGESIALDANGYNGVVIIKITTDDKSIVKKALIK